ncbi:TetR family transcriptional regulator C-terminal domain-containing protein [Alkalilacustris brevis]|uniref:TetR family transcriptional regulator C-terminal domain-containing protein n=1 Tax=Alkalilacustris brevis TaxID=2026338 RepID=UPI000E0DA337|nr:TetR family transcriptional regulator C-terminal domain-containing protein [Alkalilacustris brevis]
MNTASAAPLTRIQRRNRKLILEAALEVFSQHGFRGATLDQIAAEAGLSKPNLLYYFDNKEAIHRSLLGDLLDSWLAPLRAIDPDGEPRAEILAYVRRKIQMSRDFPRESRLFANEILQGAPRIEGFIRTELRALVAEKAAVIRGWAQAGRIADVDPMHLIFSIWALTQNYADFEAQMRMVRGPHSDPFDGAEDYLETLFSRLLAV